MCDYSLEHVENRPAKVGERLTSTVFTSSITRGFSAASEPSVVVCVLPGTQLLFDKDVECDHAIGFFPTRNLGMKTATFRQINKDQKHEHHDALVFLDGRVVLLTRLVPGQTATVVSLPVDETKTAATVDALIQGAITPVDAPVEPTPVMEPAE